MGFEYMSKVQEASYPPANEGKDIFVKGKTGTGKSVGFLVPTIQILAATGGAAPGTIGALVVSHNRDLAHQLHVEAQKLLTFHDMKAQIVVGGENMSSQKRKLETERCDILIGTPGRLVDHIESTPGFVQRLAGAKVLVLDEADQLLESGFKKALDTIVRSVGAGHQTLLFTATVPEEVKAVAAQYLKKEHLYIDTVGKEEQTHTKVPQEYVVVPVENVFGAAYAILKHQITVDPQTKAFVFCTTTRQTDMFADLFEDAGIKTQAIHSRLSQSQRNRVSEEFRNAKSGIMFSSDISARGIDMPGITFVLQIGLPESAEQYTHRIGRTGRAGAAGSGAIVLFPEEANALLPELKAKNIPVVAATASSTITGGIASGAAVTNPPEVNATIAKIAAGGPLSREVRPSYAAALGYYNGQTKRMKASKAEMVAAINKLFMSLGLKELPGIQKKTLSKMGLVGVEGIKLADKQEGGTRKRRQHALTTRRKHRCAGTVRRRRQRTTRKTRN